MSFKKPILLDANVLIDYAQSDKSILLMASEQFGPIYVPDPVVQEVDDLLESDYDQLGLIIFPPTTDQMFHAALQTWTLKIADALCFLLCQDNRWECVTNDVRVRKQCIKHGVQVIWGTELMLRLIELDQLSAVEAIEVMQTIQANNPYINQTIVEAFITKAHELESS